MPTPNPGDLFFDMEGDPLHPNGLEYLFGLTFMQDCTLANKAFWAHDHGQERTTFGEFMELLQMPFLSNSAMTLAAFTVGLFFT